ncbi:MarC family NAAT transporter [Brucella sp. 21LCYQ03]|nr:MarC family NAAT transporter [Brucella sp. 21LCYQ03]
MSFFAEVVKYVSIVVIGLLPIMNPLTTIPLYMSLTKRMSVEDKRSQARKTCIYAFAILIVFMLLGNGIISLFSISMPGIRVAGGIIIMILALRMIFSGEDTSSQVDAEPADIKKAELDYSFSPLAMPSLAGPGSIAVVMGFTSQIPADHSITGHVVIAIGIAIMVVIAYIGLSSANWIEKVLGDHGMQAVTKIMGFLLTCVAVQFLASGIREFIVEFSKLS